MEKKLIYIYIILVLFLVACGNAMGVSQDDYQPAYSENEVDDELGYNYYDDCDNTRNKDNLIEEHGNIPIINHPILGTWELIEYIMYTSSGERKDLLVASSTVAAGNVDGLTFTLHSDGRISDTQGESRWRFSDTISGYLVLPSGAGGYYRLEENMLFLSNYHPDGTIVRRTLARVNINIPIINHPILGTWELIENIMYTSSGERRDLLAESSTVAAGNVDGLTFTLHSDGRITDTQGEMRWRFSDTISGYLVLPLGAGGYYRLEENMLFLSNYLPGHPCGTITIINRTFARVN